MKLFYALIVFILFHNCSFDNKTGIWKNDNIILKKQEDAVKGFRTISEMNESFNEIIHIKKNFNFVETIPIQNFEWTDVFYSQTNNYNNFSYKGLNKAIYKSKKLSKFKVNDSILFKDNNLIISDEKGNIIFYSLNTNQIISKFNFYKKKYKKIKKKLNLIVDKNIIYVSDNLGYLYALDYQTNKILWAKNYKIPFRSNLKTSEKNLITSNQNNNLFFFDKNNGDVVKLIPTEESVVKNQFINNISLNNSSIFFLNTYGTLYSIDSQNLEVNWFLNLNQSLDINPNTLFDSTEIINNKDKIIVSSNKSIYIIDSKLGSTIYKKNFSSLIKPIIFNDYLFLISKNNLLVSIDLNNGKIIYSYNINEKIASYLNTKKEKVEFKNLFIINNKIFVFLKNSYLLKFNINGNLEKINKLSSKINTQPIFIEGSIFYVNNKNKLIIVD